MAFYITKHNSQLKPYKNHAFRVFKPKNKGLIPKLVKQIISSCEVMLSHYSKVFLVRIDLHPSQYSKDDKQITQFLNLQVKKLSKQYNCKVKYLCAREQHLSDIQHYHVALMLSGHKVCHSHKLLSQIKFQWEKLDCVASLVNKPFNMLKRGDMASLGHGIYRLSYLAKEFTKELNPKAGLLLNNKINPSQQFDPTDDIFLVDPLITFAKNKYKQSIEHKDLTSLTYIKKPSNSAWYTEPTMEQQIKESISSRVLSLDLLNNGSQQQYPMNRKRNFIH